MQTFLTSPDVEQVARDLDYRRLGKQRVECKQILNTLLGLSKGWRFHPAVKSWRGYENALIAYGMFMCVEWSRRGYEDSVFDYLLSKYDSQRGTEWPKWIDCRMIHVTHRSNLIRKLPSHYRDHLGWTEPDDLEYVWGCDL